MSKDNIGHTPVFPICDMNSHPGPIGLTIRDYFAAKAMQALLTEWDEATPFPCGIDASPVSDTDSSSQASYMARASYIYADAMLEARSK